MSTHTYTRERREARAFKHYVPESTDAQLSDGKIGGAL